MRIVHTYAAKKRMTAPTPADKPPEQLTQSEVLHMSGAGAPQPMSPVLREKFEPGFAADFSNIRISRGHIPDELGIQAVAKGTDILLDSRAGMDVLGHELAHMVQQAQGQVEGGFPVVHDAALEHQADVMGARAASALSAMEGGMTGLGGEAMSIAPMSGAAAPAMCKTKEEKEAEKAAKKAAKAQAKAGPAKAAAPAPQAVDPEAEYAALAQQAKANYANLTVDPSLGKQKSFIDFLASGNRKNGTNMPAFKSSTERVKAGQGMGSLIDNVVRGMGQNMQSRGGADETKRYAEQLTKVDMLKDQSFSEAAADMSKMMTDQMADLLDDPEYRRYVQGNMEALRGATAGRDGEQDFFGNDHNLALTLINNANLYNTMPALTNPMGRERIQNAGMDFRGFMKLSQGATGVINNMTSLLAKRDDADLTDDEITEMVNTLRQGKGTEVSDSDVLQNLKNNNPGRDSFTQEEMDQMRESLYQGRMTDAYTEEGVRSYLALYQKMRGLIASQGNGGGAPTTAQPPAPDVVPPAQLPSDVMSQVGVSSLPQASRVAAAHSTLPQEHLQRAGAPAPGRTQADAAPKKKRGFFSRLFGRK